MATRPIMARPCPTAARTPTPRCEAAVQALSDPERLEDAQRVVASSAPQLQRILDEALEAGGWFGSAHSPRCSRRAGTADPGARLDGRAGG